MAPKQVGAVSLRSEPGAGDPFVDEPRKVARADVRGMVYPTWEDEIIERPTPAFQPSPSPGPRRVEQLELHGPARFLLDNDRAVSDATTNHDVADLHLHNVAAAPLAVDREIKLEANGPAAA